MEGRTINTSMAILCRPAEGNGSFRVSHQEFPDRSARRAPILPRLEAATLAAGLHIVATPIGNLGDVTLRALATLAGADVILAEDTRVTKRLTERYAIATPLEAYH